VDSIQLFWGCVFWWVLLKIATGSIKFNIIRSMHFDCNHPHTPTNAHSLYKITETYRRLHVCGWFVTLYKLFAFVGVWGFNKSQKIVLTSWATVKFSRMTLPKWVIYLFIYRYLVTYLFMYLFILFMVCLMQWFSNIFCTLHNITCHNEWQHTECLNWRHYGREWDMHIHNFSSTRAAYYFLPHTTYV
jgi:hypothetical protein